MVEQAKRPSSLLQLLPAIYSQPELLERYPFLGNYLKIFEKIMIGLDMGAEQPLDRRKGWGQILEPQVIGELFYPRLSFLFPKDRTQFIPPLTKASIKELNDFFGIGEEPQSLAAWLQEMLAFTASWIDLYLPFDFSSSLESEQQQKNRMQMLDRVRGIIARMMPLYRQRGTQEGLQAMIDLYLDLDYRRITLLKVKVKSLADAVPWKLGSNTILYDRYQPDRPLVGGVRPWVFALNITIVCLKHQECANYQDFNERYWAHIQELIQKIYALVNREKPEYSNYVVHFHPTLEVNVARLGKTSFLGTSTSALAKPSEH